MADRSNEDEFLRGLPKAVADEIKKELDEYEQDYRRALAEEAERIPPAGTGRQPQHG